MAPFSYFPFQIVAYVIEMQLNFVCRFAYRDFTKFSSSNMSFGWEFLGFPIYNMSAKRDNFAYPFPT